MGSGLGNQTRKGFDNFAAGKVGPSRPVPVSPNVQQQVTAGEALRELFHISKTERLAWEPNYLSQP